MIGLETRPKFAGLSRFENGGRPESGRVPAGFPPAGGFNMEGGTPRTSRERLPVPKWNYARGDRVIISIPSARPRANRPVVLGPGLCGQGATGDAGMRGRALSHVHAGCGPVIPKLLEGFTFGEAAYAHSPPYRGRRPWWEIPCIGPLAKPPRCSTRNCGSRTIR